MSAASENALQALITEISRHIVGQHQVIERLLIALLSDGHMLLEGAPGLAKTKTLTTITEAIQAQMSRIQFTPDLLPADLIGTEIYRPQTGEFFVRKGPIFANLVLADEINRAPAKVQSALLQAMQERRVTIGETTFTLPDPFLVLATQNPIEQEGTYPLPEAQLDRFMMKVKVGYPSLQEEIQIVQRARSAEATPLSVSPVLSVSDLFALRRRAQAIYVDPRIDQYIVSLVHASRHGESYGLQGMIEWGASPRASLALQSCARSLAFIRGREFVTPAEVKDVAPDVLRHRIITSFEADARGITSDAVVEMLLKAISVP